VPSARTDYISFVSSAPGLDEESFLVLSMEGEERMNRPYRFEFELLSRDADIDFQAIMKEQATLGIKQGIVSSSGRKGMITVYRSGTLAAFEQIGKINEWTKYKAVLVPPLWRLSLSYQSRIFQDMTVPDIVSKILIDAGIPSDRFKFMPHSRTYPKREYVVQYEENDLDFLHRWLEHEGIFYWFQQIEGDVITVFGDSPAHYTDLGEEVSYTEMRAAEGDEETESSFDWYDTGKIGVWACRQEQIPGTVILKDYNWREPGEPLEVEQVISDDGIGIHYEFNNHYKSPEEGGVLARIRAEEILCRERVFRGQSTCRNFAAGYVFALTEHYRHDFNEKYLITEVRHSASQDIALATSSVFRSSYGNKFSAIQVDPSFPFRPERTTDWPSIKGVMNAVVDGAGDGTSPEMDALGRYKVRLPLDRSDTGAGSGSRYIRMAQPNAGKNVGFQMPLYPGTEVILTHVDGDPDRPIIAGAVPNMDTPSPVGTSNQMDSVIKTPAGKIAMHGDPEHPQTVIQSGDSVFRFGKGSPSFMYASTEWNLEKSSYGKQALSGLSGTCNAFLYSSTLVGYPWVQYGIQQVLNMAEGMIAAGVEDDTESKEDREKELKGALKKKKEDEAKEKYVSEADWDEYDTNKTRKADLEPDEADYTEYETKKARKKEIEDTGGPTSSNQAEYDDLTTWLNDNSNLDGLQEELDDLREWLTAHPYEDTSQGYHSDDEKFTDELYSAGDITDAEEEAIGSQVKTEHVGAMVGLTVAQVLFGITRSLILYKIGGKIKTMIKDKLKPSTAPPPTVEKKWKEKFKDWIKSEGITVAEKAVEQTLALLPGGGTAFSLYKLGKETLMAKNVYKPDPAKTDEEVLLSQTAFKVWRKAGRLTGATFVSQNHDGENIEFLTEVGDVTHYAGRDLLQKAGNQASIHATKGVEISAPQSTLNIAKGLQASWDENAAAIRMGNIQDKFDYAKLVVGKRKDKANWAQVNVRNGSVSAFGAKALYAAGEKSESVIRMDQDAITLTNGKLSMAIATKLNDQDAKKIVIAAGDADSGSSITLGEDGNILLKAAKGISLQIGDGKPKLDVTKAVGVLVDGDSKKIILNASEIALQGKLKDALGNEIPAMNKPETSGLSSVVSQVKTLIEDTRTVNEDEVVEDDGIEEETETGVQALIKWWEKTIEDAQPE